MKHLNQWAKGKPLGLVMMAEQLAVGAEACFEFLRLIKAGEKIEALSGRINQNGTEWGRALQCNISNFFLLWLSTYSFQHSKLWRECQLYDCKT